MTSTARIALVLLAVCSACGSEKTATEPNSAPRGVVASQIANRGPAEPAQAAQSPQPSPAPVAPSPRAQPAAPAPTTPGATAPTAAEMEAAPEKKRDYSDELQRAVGSPIDCLKQRTGPDSPAQIQVDLEAYFLETGSASRAYARGASLDGDELACIQKRLAAVTLAAPIAEAPRAVRTTLTFKLRTPDNPAN